MYRQNRTEVMAVSQQEMNVRNNQRKQFDDKLKNVLKKPKKDELDEGFIYYRWHYSDDSEDYGIHQVVNRPSTRWHLYTTGLENPGMFFYSINILDLVVDPTDPTRPRIGPYAPPIPSAGTVTMTQSLKNARINTLSNFDKRLTAAVASAKKNNQPATGKIHCRWHFTDMQQPRPKPVKTIDNTQAVRDVLTEYRVKYPNQLWISCNEKDMNLTLINGIYRPQQGTLLPTIESPSTLGSTASATASTITAGTGQTHDPPLPTGQPATKKLKSYAGTTKPTMVFIDSSVFASGSSAGTGPTHHTPGKPKSKPLSPVSVPPRSPLPATETETSSETTIPVMPMVPTDSGQDMAQVDRLDSFMGSGTLGTHSSPVDTDPSLSSAADPIPSVYLSSTPTQVHIISPDSGITGIASEETVQAIDASQLTAQPIGSLTAGTDYLSGSLLDINDPNSRNNS